ncbi:MAG: NAD(P)-dependent oxidoreductase [Desulfohalobiaceae bacterium]|nr:NAD(P)-dependent oxidoreductase [Desulfohalobiaceae bacterium]
MKIGFIGLGRMGAPMARRIREAGYDLLVYDINSAQMLIMQKAGALPAKSASMLATHTKCIILMLPDSQSVQAVVEGEQGLLATLQPGSVIVDMSTSNPLVTRRLGAALERQGSIMIDAPVSGGVGKAETGNLTIMVGGDERTYQHMIPVLKTLGYYIEHVGPLGSGHTVKVLNNLLSATHLLATVEVLSAGLKMDIDPEKMLKVINTSTGRNLSSEYKLPNFILNRQFDSHFSMDLMCKDISIAHDLINALKCPAFLPGVVTQLWYRANEKGGRGYDHTEIVRLYEEWLEMELKPGANRS